MATIVDRFVLTTGSGEDVMKARANRYRPPSYERKVQDAGFILLFAHGSGLHKELWEPTIDHLFKCDQGNESNTRVLEAWAVDCQNHGESAALNDELFSKKPDLLNIRDYGEAFASLCRSGLLGVITKGVQKVVLVGHSAGATGIVCAIDCFESPKAAPFDMVILVDAPLYAPEMLGNMTDMYKIVAKTTASRRSVWKSKEAAHVYLKERFPWKIWDPRVFELYTEHGLRPLPTPFNDEKEGVVLICSPAHEAATYVTAQPATLAAVSVLNKTMRIIPFHAVYGKRNDMFSREVQDTLHDPAAGRVLASVRRVKGAGHLVVQERPNLLAEALKDILYTGKVREWIETSKL